MTRTPQLYRIQHRPKIGCGMTDITWQDYIAKDLPATEAMQERASAERRFTGFEFRTVPAVKPKRNDILHAVTVQAKKADLDLTGRDLAKLSKQGLMMVGSFVARATNHGNRLPAPNGVMSQDRHGRLVVKMGGAR